MCVTILGGICILSGGFLTLKGYNAELLVGGGVGSITGLLGMLSTRAPFQPPAQDVTVSSNPPTVELTQPKQEEPTP